MLSPSEYQKVYDAAKALLVIERESPGSSFLLYEANKKFMDAVDSIYNSGKAASVRKIAEQDRSAWASDYGSRA